MADLPGVYSDHDGSKREPSHVANLIAIKTVFEKAEGWQEFSAHPLAPDESS